MSENGDTLTVSTPAAPWLGAPFAVAGQRLLPPLTRLHPHQCLGKKPSYEIGAASQLKLSFAKKTKPAAPKEKEPEAGDVWTLSADDFDDDDLLADNGEELLDADDLAKASTAPPRQSGAGSKGGKMGCLAVLSYMLS